MKRLTEDEAWERSDAAYKHLTILCRDFLNGNYDGGHFKRIASAALEADRANETALACGIQVKL